MTLILGKKFIHEFRVSQQKIDLFILLSEDKNILHVNRDFAISKGFKTKVAHGNILNCFVSFFVGELFPIKEIMIISQSIQFKNPVFAEDLLCFEAIVFNYVESLSVYELKFTFKLDSKLISQGKLVLKSI